MKIAKLLLQAGWIIAIGFLSIRLGILLATPMSAMADDDCRKWCGYLSADCDGRPSGTCAEVCQWEKCSREDNCSSPPGGGLNCGSPEIAGGFFKADVDNRTDSCVLLDYLCVETYCPCMK